MDTEKQRQCRRDDARLTESGNARSEQLNTREAYRVANQQSLACLSRSKRRRPGWFLDMKYQTCSHIDISWSRSNIYVVANTFGSIIILQHCTISTLWKKQGEMLLHILQRFSKFLQLPVATASTVWANQRAEFKSFCNLIGWYVPCSCNQMLQELGKAL